MERTGVIVSELDGLSKVKLLRHTACGNCGACQLGDDQKDIHLMAQNPVKACIGDMVEVSMPANGVLTAAFIMYVIPLIGLFLGMILGTFIFKDLEWAAGLFGLATMALSFVIIKMNERKITSSTQYTAVIQSVVQKNHDGITLLE